MKKKTCLDCLNCKVSARSTVNCRLCFCSETVKKERHKEPYWLAKKICKNFNDMTEKQTSAMLFPANKRLLWARTNRN